MSRSWLKKIRQFAGRGGKRRSHRSPRRRLNLELLEDRTLLNAGDLDLSFGGSGMVSTDLGRNDGAYGAATVSRWAAP